MPSQVSPSPRIGLRRALGRGMVAALLASAAEYGLVVLLVEVIHLRPAPATHLGYVVGGLINFCINRRWTFASRGSRLSQAWRYALISFAGGYLAGRGVMFAAWLGLDYRLAVPLAYGAVSLLWNLPLQRFVVFSNAP